MNSDLTATKRLITAIALTTLLSACGDLPSDYTPQEGDNAEGHSPATATTAAANARVAADLPLADQEDFELARKGLIASADSLIVKNGNGDTVWNQDRYGFVAGDAPDSVNPSLWRQAKLNSIHGLFKVTEGIYQLRGFDLANMTVIESDNGWILVDPLTTKQTAANAFKFVQRHLGEKPIKAILFTHSHVDHFGGIEGIASAAEIKEQGIRIVVPKGFVEEAVSENVLAGRAMQRRAGYQYGQQLSRNERGHVDLGLGKEVPFGGDVSITQPTDIIGKTGETLTIDGVEIQFQYAPASEAPAEFTFYLPKQKAFCGAEVVSRTMHNIYTLRGAKVRNALVWSNYIEEARKLFGEAEIYFASHHWPLWGKEKIQDFLKKQRDIYKFTHDQTLRMANAGMTPLEIAEAIKLPDSLKDNFATRGYYGTLKHNARAVYNWYFGYYDGNPAHLDPLPPTAAGAKYVELAGGAEALIEKAQAAFDKGEYRWAAELLNHMVFAAPENNSGRQLLAKTYDQMGYQAESGPWRDVYLSAAFELRHGAPEKGMNMTDAIGMLREIPVSQFFDAMSAGIDSEKAADKDTRVKFVFTDLGETHLLWLENAVLHHEPADQNTEADATIELTHDIFMKMVIGTAGIKDTLLSDDMNVDGSRLKLIGFFRLLDKPTSAFSIVTPE